MIEWVVPYCERIESGTEWFNVWSNAAFFLVGAYTVIALKPGGLAQWLLVSLTFLIGAGSGLFHAIPSPLTHALDIVPVILFAILLTVLIMMRARLPVTRIVVILVFWMLASALASLWPEVLGQSLFYVPTVLLLFTMGSYLTIPGSSLYPLAIVFTLALVTRAADLPLCSSIPVGTHMLWHLLTAMSCGLGLQVVINDRK